MNKKISAVCAALLISASMFSGCGNKQDPEENSSETSINIIQDGTEAPSMSEESGIDPNTTTFFDPGANFIGGEDEDTTAETDSPDPEAPEETSVEVTLDQDALISMIQSDVEAQQTPIITEYNVDYKTRYGYNCLNDQEKALYKEILDAAVSLKPKVKLDDSVTNEMWIKVYGCVYMQEPQLFWLASKGISRGKLKFWEIDTSIINSMKKEIEESSSKVLAEASGKDTFGKLEVFHDYITLNNNFVKQEGFNQTIYGGFVNGELQCEGYAKTMQYLCDLAGIESMIVVGSNEANESHAWNVVKVDGEWYNIDSTWDDPLLKEVNEKNYRHRYFLVPDEWIHNKSHFNINTKISGTQVKYFDPPKCTATKMNYFAVKGELFSDKASADAALKEKLKSYASKKLRAVEIRVSSKDVYDAITGNLKEYASWIKKEDSSVTSVASNCDPNTLVIELDLNY